MKGAKLFLEAAKRHGVRKAFGIVGGEASAILFDEVEELDFYLTRHEFTAGIMADVYARLRGVPQIAYSTFGPGMTNLATGVASAMLDRAPMIAVSAQVDRREIIFNQTHQCLDNASIMRPMTKFAHELESAEEIPWALATAAKASRAELSGPSFISFPRDVMMEDVPDSVAERMLDDMESSEPQPFPAPSVADVQRLAQEIGRAKNPVILAGNLVIREDACAGLRAFVESFGIPVITSLASKGVLPEDHPLHIGPLNKYLDGILHHPVLDAIFGECDLMLLVGFDFAEDVKPDMWQRCPKGRTVMYGPLPNTIEKVFTPDLAVQGNLKQGLEMLAAAGPPKPKSPPAFLQELRERKGRSGEKPLQSYPTIPAQGIVKSVRTALGKDGILCSDIGMHKQYAGLFSETHLPNTFICSNGCGTFGFGLPAGLGAKVAHPEKRVAVICGDGGFHSTSQDMETAVRYGLPIVVVLLKDNSFGLIKYYQLSGHDRVNFNAVDFGDVDFVRLAQANGWNARFVTSRDMLDESLAEGFARNKPTLLEIPVRYQYRF